MIYDFSDKNITPSLAGRCFRLGSTDGNPALLAALGYEIQKEASESGAEISEFVQLIIDSVPADEAE